MKAFIIGVVLFIATGMVLPLLLAEFFEWAPWMAEGIVRAAARRVPLSARSEQLRYWEAELDAAPGKLWKLYVALDILRTSGPTGRAIADTLVARPQVKATSAVVEERLTIYVDTYMDVMPYVLLSDQDAGRDAAKMRLLIRYLKAFAKGMGLDDRYGTDADG